MISGIGFMLPDGVHLGKIGLGGVAMLASRPVVSVPDGELMLAHSPFSSIERFGLSALASLQSVPIWGIMAFFVLVIGDMAGFKGSGNGLGVGIFCLLLGLFVGVLCMPFVFYSVWKAMSPVVNERLLTWKKLIISVLASMSVGQILWIMGTKMILFILDMIEARSPYVDFFVSLVFAPTICAGFAIWFGYKFYRRLSAAELILAEDVSRKFGDAVRRTTNDSSVQRSDGSVITPQH